EPFEELKRLAVERRIPLKTERDKPFIAGIPLPAANARATANGTLLAIRIRPARGDTALGRAIALVQVTDLAIHGRMALDGGIVWVTGVRDGRPRAGVVVTVYDAGGKARAKARTDAQGYARFSGLEKIVTTATCDECDSSFEGYVAAVLNDDRAVAGFTSYDPDLAAWRFGVWSAWSPEQRVAAAAAVFTERGIYRPGERVYAKAIARTGSLGSLTAPRGDSLKWVFRDRENGVLKDTTTSLTSFGTADQWISLSPDAALGEYQVQVSLKRDGEWRNLNAAAYQVAEYRPPEFLVDVNADTKPRFAGDTVTANISARYLFGAPMAGAQVRWVVQHRPLYPWELEIPNVEDWDIGTQNFDDYEMPESEVAG
ncbi:MAG TPA: MG2 domain-containing protein, partial [Burkholderiales bacterium]|nr:MG2 domain-containing protein [Burkholderiales bacterium]